MVMWIMWQFELGTDHAWKSSHKPLYSFCSHQNRQNGYIHPPKIFYLVSGFNPSWYSNRHLQVVKHIQTLSELWGFWGLFDPKSIIPKTSHAAKKINKKSYGSLKNHSHSEFSICFFCLSQKKTQVVPKIKNLVELTGPSHRKSITKAPGTWWVCLLYHRSKETKEMLPSWAKSMATCYVLRRSVRKWSSFQLCLITKG